MGRSSGKDCISIWRQFDAYWSVNGSEEHLDIMLSVEHPLPADQSLVALMFIFPSANRNSIHWRCILDFKFHSSYALDGGTITAVEPKMSCPGKRDLTVLRDSVRPLKRSLKTATAGIVEEFPSNLVCSCVRRAPMLISKTAVVGQLPGNAEVAEVKPLT
jgi:hypothetical protein